MSIYRFFCLCFFFWVSHIHIRLQRRILIGNPVKKIYNRSLIHLLFQKYALPSCEPPSTLSSYWFDFFLSKTTIIIS